MSTLVHDPLPVEVAELIERRKRLGQDLYDEVWEGVLHMNPAPANRHGDIQAQLAALLRPLAVSARLTITGPFNIGVKDDFRVPDTGLRRDRSDQVWNSTAALVIEIVSPGDETYAKFGFYAAHGVDELVIVDPDEHRVSWFALSGGRYEPVDASAVIELGPAELTALIDWP